jgi:hypothetical protein
VNARRGVFWPLLLIALGLIFLLQNFGFISGVSWLAVASLWPLLLILIGLDIAFARRWPLPTLAVEVGLIAAGIALVAYSPNLSPGIFVFGNGGGTGESKVAVPRGATQLNLTLNGGAIRSYHVSGGATELVEANSANPDLRVRATSGTGGRADVRLDQVSNGFFHPIDDGDIQIRLASDVPTSLTLNVGAGEFDVDLSDVRVTDAKVNVGASSMRLVVPKPTGGDVAIRMNGGASNIVIVVPDGVEARIATTGGLLSLRSDNTRLGTDGGTRGCVACGSSVETSGYGTAQNRVTLTIAAGASSIVVR